MNNFSIILIIFGFLILIHTGCGNDDSYTKKAIKDVEEQCLYRISTPNEDKMSRVEVGLGPNWQYSSHSVEKLFNENFFFLFHKQSKFIDKTDNTLTRIVYSVYSCSGEPPHILLLEREHFSKSQNNETLKLIKKEVLENSNLSLAPTDEDTSSDTLYNKIKNEKTK